MQEHILFIILGILLLYGGGEALVRGAGSLALRCGMTPLIAGLTVVAFGTSTPELVASVNAGLMGQGDIAIGNAVGSNCFNIGIILALTALICPLKPSLQVMRFDAPFMLAVQLLPLWFLHDRSVTRVEGAVLIVLIIAYVVWILKKAKSSPESAEVAAEYAAATKQRGTAALDLALIAGGLALLVLGSRWLVNGSVAIATHFGLSQALIGLTIVAAGTSAPELAASIVAALRKQPDIALGNIVGSNIFNILAIVGITGLTTPLSAPGVAGVDVVVMILFAAGLIPMLRSGGTLDRSEGACLLAGYAIYLWHLWPK